ncbi:MAG: hypothetical protein KC588_16410, partial [Nitrospira sp.]|nr:hypothetical protein [Nitrospira sp.]
MIKKAATTRRSLYNRGRYIDYYTMFRGKRYPHMTFRIHQTGLGKTGISGMKRLFHTPFQEELIRLMSHGSFHSFH